MPHITTELIQSSRELERLESEWQELFCRSGCDNPFLTFDWMHEWWTRFGRGHFVFVVAVRSSGRLIGIAPFCTTSGQHSAFGAHVLTFLSGSWVGSDHLDLIAEPDFEATVVSEAAATILRRRSCWDLIEFSHCDESSPTIAQLRAALKGNELRECVMGRGISPFVVLPDSYDEYLAGLSTHWRRNIRHALRLLQHRGNVTLLAIEKSTDIQDWYERTIALHRLRFEGLRKPSVILDDNVHAFHCAALRRMAAHGWARLYVLTLDGEALAGCYGLCVSKRFCALQSGFNPEWAKQSVGSLLIGMAIEDCIVRGNAEFDFLRGDERYKFHWADQSRPLITTRFCDATMIGDVAFAASRLSAAWGASRRMLREAVERRPAIMHRGRLVGLLP
jgi:CelD/BcsL family acetyltransferase involved in cellulose biosynthesis